MVVCTISAHHNVADFRPYSIHFKDKGEKNANIAHALKLAIKRESKWNGWFEYGGLLEGTSLKEVNKKIDEMFVENKDHIVIPGFDLNEEDEVVLSEHTAFIIWNKKEDNIGFGEAQSEDRSPTINDLDKYSNKWLEVS